MVLVYNLFIQLYVLAIRIASLWNTKAGEWLEGRKNLFEKLEKNISTTDRIVWVHCASAGELEQGKPLIEEIRKHFPSHKFVLSVFSPSGFSVAKKYKHVDFVTYLPADTSANANRFVSLLHPELVIFVKYEYWYHHLSAIAFRHIPLLLVSAIFRKGQPFFSWYGKLYRQILFLFRWIFVQDAASLRLLQHQGVTHCSIAGDTRFDRVKKIAGEFSELPSITEFVGSSPVIVAGSTWPEDEKLLSEYMIGKSLKMIIAPHEINETHVQQIEKLFPGSIRYSTLNDNKTASQVLIIDNIGMLSRLYYYATVAYIGGGFNKTGIHNTLEAAVYGKPVFFGPVYEKFREARELIESGAAVSISSAADLKRKMDHLLNDPRELQLSVIAAKKYVEKNTGATQTILNFVQENRLLTN